jgi:hypothetical protein
MGGGKARAGSGGLGAADGGLLSTAGRGQAGTQADAQVVHHDGGNVVDANYDDGSTYVACPASAETCRNCVKQQCQSGLTQCYYSQACVDYLDGFLVCANDSQKLPGDLILCLASQCPACTNVTREVGH